jgi:hypothetical protein
MRGRSRAVLPRTTCHCCPFPCSFLFLFLPRFVSLLSISSSPILLFLLSFPFCFYSRSAPSSSSVALFPLCVPSQTPTRNASGRCPRQAAGAKFDEAADGGTAFLRLAFALRCKTLMRVQDGQFLSCSPKMFSVCSHPAIVNTCCRAISGSTDAHACHLVSPECGKALLATNRSTLMSSQSRRPSALPRFFFICNLYAVA